jgi:large subunit ribosomal protein L18
MAAGKKIVVPYRRKRDGKTDYKHRLKILLSQKPRFVVRKSNTRLIVQIITYTPDGDNIQLNINSSILKTHGWKYALNNIPAAYLLGIVAGKIAQKNNITEAIFDMGREQSIKGSKLYAVLKGAIDSGLKIPANPSIFPSEDRLMGKHISNYAETAPGFQKLKKEKVDFKNMEKQIQTIKTSVLGK